MTFRVYSLCSTSLTFHEGCVGAAVVVKVSAVRVVQAVVSQAVCVAETLQDAVHETLQRQQWDSLTKISSSLHDEEFQMILFWCKTHR